MVCDVVSFGCCWAHPQYQSNGFGYIMVNCSDRTATSLESWSVRGNYPNRFKNYHISDEWHIVIYTNRCICSVNVHSLFFGRLNGLTAYIYVELCIYIYMYMYIYIYIYIYIRYISVYMPRLRNFRVNHVNCGIEAQLVLWKKQSIEFWSARNMFECPCGMVSWLKTYNCTCRQELSCLSLWCL